MPRASLAPHNGHDRSIWLEEDLQEQGRDVCLCAELDIWQVRECQSGAWEVAANGMKALDLRPLSHDDIMMVCHSYQSSPILCHGIQNGDPSKREKDNVEAPDKYTYTVVQDVETGDTYPTVFSSHQGFASIEDVAKGEANNVLVHANEIVLVDKKAIDWSNS